jgi:hypothetical protein
VVFISKYVDAVVARLVRRGGGDAVRKPRSPKRRAHRVELV